MNPEQHELAALVRKAAIRESIQVCARCRWPDLTDNDEDIVTAHNLGVAACIGALRRIDHDGYIEPLPTVQSRLESLVEVALMVGCGCAMFGWRFDGTTWWQLAAQIIIGGGVLWAIRRIFNREFK